MVWIAGRHRGDAPWEVLGLFQTEAEAVKRATGIVDFVGPLTIGESESDVPVDWPGCYFPQLAKASA